jgi:hypothetical protein
MSERLQDAAVEVEELVDLVHAQSGQLVIAVTGAGTRALAWLFSRGGASRTVLEAIVPYSTTALNDFTGKAASQHVSASEAALMAERALKRALLLTSSDGNLLAGIGCTAAIATDRLRRGENRCHVAFATSDGRRGSASLTMVKGARDRAAEEDIASRLVLNAVAEAKGLGERVGVPLLDDEKIERSVASPGV